MANQYQKGIFTIEDEINVESLPVKGEFPDWLSGTLLRNGPAKFEVGKEKYRHWFDGLAMLHNFTVRNKQVSYVNKFLRSKAFKGAEKSGRIRFPEFATDPCGTIFAKFFTLFKPTYSHNANVNITKIAEQYVALTETPMPVEFNPKTLETIGVYEYPVKVKGQLTTAHPHFDFKNKAMYNYKTHISRISSYNIYCMDSKESQNIVASIKVKEPSYMHSFSMTENYVILTEFPLVLNPIQFIASGKPFIENFKWHPEKGTRFQIVNRHTGELVQTIVTDSFFAFHHVNAFERDDHIIVDIAMYEDATIIEEFYIDNMLNNDRRIPTATLERFTLSLKAQTYESKQLFPDPIELPRINYYKYNSKQYKFVYGVGSGRDYFSDRLLKLDIDKRVKKEWKELHCFPSEPVFVPRPNAKNEDEGVVLSVVLQQDKNISFLLCLDATTMTEIARAEVPHAIPLGLHGNFYNL